MAKGMFAAGREKYRVMGGAIRSEGCWDLVMVFDTSRRGLAIRRTIDWKNRKERLMYNKKEGGMNYADRLCLA